MGYLFPIEKEEFLDYLVSKQLETNFFGESMRIAIVHEWLTFPAGSEKVLEQMLHIFQDADIFALVDFLPQKHRDIVCDRPVATSFIQSLPFAKTKYRQYLPLMPLAIEQFDLSGYDLIISSSHAVAKGVLTGPDQLHISYVHSPIRYAWDLQHQYLRESGLDRGLKGWLAKWMLHKIRMWDVRTANGVDEFVANSRFIARRVSKIYRRDARVIYPPVNISGFTPGETKDDFYLAASRMVPYKRMDLIVEAFSSMPERRLHVIGEGPDFEKVASKAGKNVTMLGYQDSASLRDYMQRARALIFAAEEDFGILPVEAQACGTPVIAYGKGGARETVVGIDREHPTGVFFESQTVDSLCKAVDLFESECDQISPEACRDNAERFSEERFRKEFQSFVLERWQAFRDELD